MTCFLNISENESKILPLKTVVAYITMGDERKQDPTTVSKRVACYNTWGWVTKAKTPPPPSIWFSEVEAYKRIKCFINCN